MAGIIGFNWVDKDLLQNMLKDIRTRGGDKEDIFFDNYFSIGVTQFININEKKREPLFISNDLHTILIGFDGIIYNLNDFFKDSDIDQKNNSDCKKIMYLYENRGLEFLKHLNGMFAFFIYDCTKNCLYLIRDRLGIKPLFYFSNNGKLIFASEIKAFKHHRDLSFQINNNSVLQYFLTRSIAEENFFADIKALEPGSYLDFNLLTKQISIKKYFNPFKMISKDIYLKNKTKNIISLVNELDAILNKIIKDQITEDETFGAICSGGVDSSLLSAIAKKYNRKLKIFNVKVEDDLLDESFYAKKVANHLGLNLIEEILNKEKFLELYRKCINLSDLPLIHPCSVGIHLISKRAYEENVTVLFMGEGADELFGGYDHYRHLYRRLFFSSRPILNLLNEKFRNILFFDNFTNFMLEDANYIINKYQNLPWNESRVLITKNWFDNLSFLEDNFERKMNSYILKDMKYYLLPTLWEADRMTSGARVEMRLPFLDNRIVQCTTNLPLKYKVGFTNTKILLKKEAERYLPMDIVYRKKMGFGIPTEKWFGEETSDVKKIMYDEWEEIFFN